jgi:hypothetical protein
LGNVESVSCPPGWLSRLESSISPAGGGLHVTLANYIGPVAFPTTPGVLTQYIGESETSASGEFVITGGSGAGELIARGGNDSAGYIDGMSVSEAYTSNFLPYPDPYRMTDIVTVPFTFGVPFALTVGDDMKFSGASTGRALSIEDGSFWDAYFFVYDSDGNRVPGAIISGVSEVSAVPEASSIWLLFTSVVGFGFMLRGRAQAA